jgi:hypothetical protein
MSALKKADTENTPKSEFFNSLSHKETFGIVLQPAWQHGSVRFSRVVQ